ncbi:UNVERIFIED_CONTAM: peptidase domain-containing ABC transporter [Ralstonia mannitolilytica]
MFNKFPFYSQIEQMDCGPVCLKIILKYYGKDCDLVYLRNLTEVTRSGVTLADINDAGKKLYFHTTPFKVPLSTLNEDVHLPCILHWEQEHFVVLYKIKNNFYYISDPKYGRLKLKKEQFVKLWISSTDNEGIGLQLIPKEEFVEFKPPFEQQDLKIFKSYIRSVLEKQNFKIGLLIFLITISSVISYIFPQLIQKMFDEGMKSKEGKVIIGIFGFQMLLYGGQILINILQNFVGVHFSSQVSIKMLNDLLQKTVRLPVSFFENRLYTDLLQKIEEQSKIEQLLTRQLLSNILSVFLLIVLIIRLLIYNQYIALGFLGIAVFSTVWIYLFHNKRRIIDYYAFKLNSESKNHLVEMITGMVSVKISNAHISRISKWEELQKKIYKTKVKSLILDIYQTNVTSIIKQLFIFSTTFFCVYWVSLGKMTVGEMLSIGYIIGIASAPIENLVAFFRSFQDSSLVYKRVQEILQQTDENLNLKDGNQALLSKDISLNNVWFKYPGGHQPYVLKNINFKIPNGKVLAIVGESGSGKTTLSKLLLGFYPSSEGDLNIGQEELFQINHDWWRSNCGVVLQDSYIFSGTIRENIAMQEDADEKLLISACKLANIYEMIQSLPLGFDTKIGAAGDDLSGGQKQRILIARAVYKNPDFIFFDEATSALDAENEKIIHDNLQEFFKGRTVVIIAHRLSTVKSADNIIVLKKGEVVEQGNHQELVSKKGEYFNLVRNQLELGE